MAFPSISPDTVHDISVIFQKRQARLGFLWLHLPFVTTINWRGTENGEFQIFCAAALWFMPPKRRKGGRVFMQLMGELLEGRSLTKDLLAEVGLMKEHKIKLMGGAEWTAHLGDADCKAPPEDQPNRRNSNASECLKRRDKEVGSALQKRAFRT
jgi:hypothetical protein